MQDRKGMKQMSEKTKDWGGILILDGARIEIHFREDELIDSEIEAMAKEAEAERAEHQKTKEMLTAKDGVGYYAPSAAGIAALRRDLKAEREARDRAGENFRKNHEALWAKMYEFLAALEAEGLPRGIEGLKQALAERRAMAGEVGKAIERAVTAECAYRILAHLRSDQEAR